jgi:DNA-directed RNA polymerase specialized sigma24 family protein
MNWPDGEQQDRDCSGGPQLQMPPPLKGNSTSSQTANAGSRQGGAWLVEDPEAHKHLRAMTGRIESNQAVRQELLQEALLHLWLKEQDRPGQTPSWYYQSCRRFLGRLRRTARSVDLPRSGWRRVEPHAGTEDECWDRAEASNNRVMSEVCARDLLTALGRLLKPNRKAVLDLGLLRTAPSNVDVYAPDAFGEYVPIGADSRAALAMFPNDFGRRKDCVIGRGAGSAGVMFRSARRWLIQIDAETHCGVVLPQFWFPGWTVTSSNTRGMVRVQRREDSGLLEMESPPGEHLVDLRLEPLAPERIGTWLSVFGAGIAGLGLALVLRRRALEPAQHSHRPQGSGTQKKAVHRPGTAAEPQGSSCTPHPGQGG